MNVITLSPWALALAAVLVLALALALLSLRLRLTLAQEIIIAALRTTVQLLLVGLVLKTLFTHVYLGWITLIASAMLLIAGREVVARQRHGYTGMWGFGMSLLSMFVASFSVTILALVVLIGPTPWYAPQYSIPLLGMMLGNVMSGVALDRLTQSAWHQRAQIEARLLPGQDWTESVSGLRRDAVRVGLIPTVNAMAAAGVVSLPGMMTGQILAGTPPLEAVKYQILVMFLVTACMGFGTLAAVWLGARRLFDERERLRIDRLRAE